MPLNANGQENVFVGRIRKDTSNYCRPSDFKDDILKFATWLSNHNSLSDIFGEPVYKSEDIEDIVREYLETESGN